MIWSDIVLTLANLTFTYALIPQVRQGFKTKKGAIVLQTDILTSLGLFASALAFLSLNLIFSATICNINAILWTTLTFQKIIFKE